MCGIWEIERVWNKGSISFTRHCFCIQMLFDHIFVWAIQQLNDTSRPKHWGFYFHFVWDVEDKELD